jgi:hypothetical protein
MEQKTYYKIAAVVFAVIAVGHAVRIYNDWPAVVAGVDVPMWASWVALAIAGYLAVRGWQFSQKKGK